MAGLSFLGLGVAWVDVGGDADCEPLAKIDFDFDSGVGLA